MSTRYVYPGDTVEVKASPYPAEISVIAGMPGRPVIEAAIEWRRATAQHPTPMRSAHEGFAILKEEVDELWAEVIRKNSDPEAVKKEAIQVAAMALRFLADVCGVK